MKKIIITSLLLLTIINNFYNCFAFENYTKDLIPYAQCEELMSYNGNPVRVTYVAYQENGVYYPAYCLDIDLPGVFEEGYAVNITEEYRDIDVWRVLINGFPFKSIEELGAQTEEEAFTATKMAIYTVHSGKLQELFAPVDSDAGRRTFEIYTNIMNSYNESTADFIDEIQTTIVSENENWEIDSLNKNCVSKTYKIESNIKKGNYKIELKGNIPDNIFITDLENNEKGSFNIGEKFKILIPVEDLIKTDEFEINSISNLSINSIYYGKSTIVNKQNYVLAGYRNEESNYSYNEKYFENTTNLKIVKKEYAKENHLEGVKFNLLDENKKIIKENLITDSKGEIIVEKLIPGKYYIQEVGTLDNYELYNDLIEVNLELNEELETIVYNHKKEIKQEIKKEIKEEIKKLPVTGY